MRCSGETVFCLAADWRWSRVYGFYLFTLILVTWRHDWALRFVFFDEFQNFIIRILQALLHHVGCAELIIQRQRRNPSPLTHSLVRRRRVLWWNSACEHYLIINIKQRWLNRTGHILFLHWIHGLNSNRAVRPLSLRNISFGWWATSHNCWLCQWSGWTDFTFCFWSLICLINLLIIGLHGKEWTVYDGSWTISRNRILISTLSRTRHPIWLM